MRIGIFGGSFDPVHMGHLWIAGAAVETLGLDELRFLPAAKNPLKEHGPVASDAQRVEMLRLAIGGNAAFRVDEREIARGQISYTVDTLREYRDEFPDADLFFIIGGDSLGDFDRWKSPAEILKLASLACVRRGGQGGLQYDKLDAFCDERSRRRIEANEIVMPVIELSSRDVRQRIMDQRSIRYMVPAAVESMIKSETVYR